LKRHSRAGAEASALAPPRHQLSLPFQPTATGAPTANGIRPRSRRALRPAEAARQVRLKPTPEQEADRVAAGLSIYLPPGKMLELRLTNNHYSMISVRRKPDGYRLRLHRMFVAAEPRVMRALARYVVHNDRRASTLLGEYIEDNQHIIRQQTRRPRKFTLRTAGRHHDLQAIYDRLNAERFGGELDARITWGPVATRRRRRRSIKMGSFAVEDRIIRIHPSLDRQTRGPSRKRPPPFSFARLPRRGALLPRLRPRLRLGKSQPRPPASGLETAGERAEDGADDTTADAVEHRHRSRDAELKAPLGVEGEQPRKP
jgi:hypothetical protein